ncbi:MAG: energy-coupling factor ABC transporter permease [Candidatus Thorarchaeota archaeon]|nr:energy-coupling factor ABC transporter permease [Candidatus Thorarchaeota archaeon]
MHVPDGIIPLWLQVLLLVVSGTVMVISYRKIRARFDDRFIPFIGVLAAVIFAAQLVNFPVPPFSSGHLVGSTLLAVMVGPWAGMLIIGLVLFVQVLYGDGGILTYGLNLFNMGAFSVFLGYGIALLLFKFLRGKTTSDRAVFFSAGFAAFIVTTSAAFVLGLELLTVPGFGIEALAAITGVHIIIGLGEAILTSIILLYFVKANPHLISFLKDDSEEVEEQEDNKLQPGYPIKKVASVLAFSIIVITSVILIGLASQSPDGFEWALFVYAGIPEPENGFQGLWSFLGENQFVNAFTGSVGIIAVLGLAYLIFRKSTHYGHDHEHTDKFLIPFDEGKQKRRLFSSTGLLLSSIAVAVVISLQTTLSSILILIGLIILSGWLSGTRWRDVISLATKFEVVILFWIILEPFIYGSTVIFTINLPWGFLNANAEGLYLGLLLGSRMFAILLTLLTALSHMTLSEFTGALRTLRVPNSIVGSLLIMFRYVPLFIEERSRMHNAQKLRGFSRGRRFERIRSLGYLVGTSINRSFDRSITAYESMSLRGFSKGTKIPGAGLRKSDVFLPILVVFLIVSLPFMFSILLEVIFP